MVARIYSPAKNPLQSGRGKLGIWILEFAPQGIKTKDPLMGWTSSTDTKQQVRITFHSKDAAIEYATKNHIEFELEEAKPIKRVIRAYADNFSSDRKEPWSH